MSRDPIRQKEAQQRHRERNFERYMEYLWANPCVDCGEANPVVLDMDHLPGVDKKFDIARAVSSSTRSWKVIEEEMAKCESVCANCHRIRTSARNNWRKHQMTVGEYVRPEILDKPVDKFRVEHGGGAKGRRNCPCDPCRTKKKSYDNNWNAENRKPATA